MPNRRTRLASALLLTQLTAGQRRVVEVVASGLGTAEAAEQLNITRQGAHKLWLSACTSYRVAAEHQTAAAAELDVSSLPPASFATRQGHKELRARARACLAGAVLTEKQRAALTHLAEHGNIRQAARECGCSAVTVHTALRRLPAGALVQPFDSGDLEACSPAGGQLG